MIFILHLEPSLNRLLFVTYCRPMCSSIPSTRRGVHMSGEIRDPFFSGKATRAAVRTNWLSDVTGRLGYASGPWLFYAKGGVAWAHNNYDIQHFSIDLTAEETRTGWTSVAGSHGRFRTIGR